MDGEAELQDERVAVEVKDALTGQLRGLRECRRVLVELLLGRVESACIELGVDEGVQRSLAQCVVDRRPSREERRLLDRVNPALSIDHVRRHQRRVPTTKGSWDQL